MNLLGKNDETFNQYDSIIITNITFIYFLNE